MRILSTAVHSYISRRKEPALKSLKKFRATHKKSNKTDSKSQNSIAIIAHTQVLHSSFQISSEKQIQTGFENGHSISINSDTYNSDNFVKTPIIFHIFIQDGQVIGNIVGNLIGQVVGQVVGQVEDCPFVVLCKSRPIEMLLQGIYY